MPRLPLYLRRRFGARRRMDGLGVHRRFDGRRLYIGRRHGAGGYRSRRHSMGRFRGLGVRNRSGAGPASDVALLLMPSASVAQRAGENHDPALAGPPPAFWCPRHGWVICPMHGYGSAAGVDAAGWSPTSVFDFGGTSAAAVDAAAPLLPSPTPAVVEMEGDATAAVSHANAAVSHANAAVVMPRASATVVEVEAAAPRLPSPTPTTPPPSPRMGARRRLAALGLPLPSPPASSHGRRSGVWSPAALGLSSSFPNGVASTFGLPGGSSPEDVNGGPRTSVRRR